MRQASDGDLDGKLAVAQRELSEALERQAATDEVLRVIASSPGELERVFDAPCWQRRPNFAEPQLRHPGGCAREMASARSQCYGGLPPAWIEQWRSGTLFYRPGPNRPIARAAAARQPIQSCGPAVRTRPISKATRCRFAAGRNRPAFARCSSVPMLKENELIGVIGIYRQEVGRSPTSRSSW